MTLDTSRTIHGINTRATPIGPYSTGTLQLGPSNVTNSYPTADVAYAIRAIAVGSGDVLALALTTGSISGSTSFVAGVAQVETATVTAASGITANGNATVTVTAAGMTGSPKAISVAVTTASNTATLVAAALAVGLNADTAYSALYTATSSGATVINTRKPTSTHTVPGGTLNLYAANDATLNVAIANGTCTGITTAATSVDTTAGVISDGVKIYGAGADFEGEALSTIVTLYGTLFEVTTGAGVIAGNVDDVTPYSTGSVVQWCNPNGLTNETALTITPSSLTDISITVLGKSS